MCAFSCVRVCSFLCVDYLCVCARLCVCVLLSVYVLVLPVVFFVFDMRCVCNFVYACVHFVRVRV